jgi:hypothetical protein
VQCNTTTTDTAEIYPHQAWHTKTDPRIFWRGNANSAFLYPSWNWRAAQRFRLSDFVRPQRPGANVTEDELKHSLEAEGGVDGEVDDAKQLKLLNEIATVQPESIGVLSKEGSGVWERVLVDREEEAERTMDVSLINQVRLPSEH